ncbi:siroheme decarboxylase subunit beta [Arhodomonas sp. SL1]|uniref:siroheme decarboxylase subunit beta n=1 Tax=Arhodomonas sp. SL1 TaxID=3425691 RepID=UPI003F881C59
MSTRPAAVSEGLAAAQDLPERLLRCYPRGLPLNPRPYREMGRALEVTETDVCQAAGALLDEGRISRIGAVFRPGAVGASTLAAMAVPAPRLETVAAAVNARPEVNHNYQREHRFNLWFVVTAADRESVAETLADLAAETGITPLSLPLVTEYHIDLSVLLGGEPEGGRRVAPRPPAEPLALDGIGRRILDALQRGLRPVPRPFAELAACAGVSEATVLTRLSRWHESGRIARLGLIARHRRAGYRHNAMVVWDVADEAVDDIGQRFAGQPFVTLCYRRPRRPPLWPYNLFCMIHGRDRSTVHRQAAALAEEAGGTVRGHALLFSNRCFKQRGARYAGGSA